MYLGCELSLYPLVIAFFWSKVSFGMFLLFASEHWWRHHLTAVLWDLLKGEGIYMKNITTENIQKSTIQQWCSIGAKIKWPHGKAVRFAIWCHWYIRTGQIYRDMDLKFFILPKQQSDLKTNQTKGVWLKWCNIWTSTCNRLIRLLSHITKYIKWNIWMNE
jgi:hypothetical protein